MATPLTDSINALTTYANEVTGASDTNLSDAVHTLASGYGGGDEYLLLQDSNLTTSTNIDTYFSTLIDGWDTDIIMLFLDDGVTVGREFIGCFSAFAYNKANPSPFNQVWRRNGTTQKYETVSRSSYEIHGVQGKKYKIVRLKDVPLV